MTLLLPTLAVAFAAFCVWLTVRIVNRRERWAKWTAVGLAIALPGIYGCAYALMVQPVRWRAYGSDPRWHGPVLEVLPRYGGPGDQNSWRQFFGPAHWLDRRVRSKLWAID